MKKLLSFSCSPLVLIILLFSGCVKDQVTRTYKIMRPVYADKAEVYANIKAGPVHQLSSTGKIYVRGNYLFINEVDKGIHIFNNANPSSPQALSFINIPGNLDIAVNGHYLYADMYGDMLTIDIQDPLNPKLVDTNMNVFPERYYGNGMGDPTKIIVDWIVKDTTVTEKPGSYNWFGGCPNCDFLVAPTAFYSEKSQKANYVPGIAGSMARFVTLNNYLYAVNQGSLIVFDINSTKPVMKNYTYIGWLIETIYPFNNRLFIGSSTGMFIYNIDDPASPVQEGTFSHARACDPVVTDGNYAYVTLRTGSACDGTSNQLDVLDVSNIYHPNLLKSYPLSNPHGLGIDGDLLFVCDGTDGVKVFDATKPTELLMIGHITNIDAFDAIPWSNLLIVSADDGLYQYDYSDQNNIRLLSTIHVVSK